ncbi:hypothetical protein [Methanolobus psychrotolerans]|uniref:hypothetical protein n=1 Tax=Methanolobus psychrotolerans TaxID=1874706 RepID=UPI000B916666|nr:hypothetical protein [Methanolobus psychrotolerans]
MEKQTCIKCNDNMKLIDKYSQFLEPDEMKKFTNQQKVNSMTSKITEVLNPSIVNVEIYKCDKCGDYRGVEDV